MDTTEIAKVSAATCPHKHVVDTVHAVLTRYASKLAAGEIYLDEVKVKFAASVYSRVAANDIRGKK